MKSFTQIALPHDDIIKGKFTMDVFAADLWLVHKGQAPLDYQDADLFFQKTYETRGLKNLFDIAEKRLKGEGGEAVIQLITPFGGGKTHALIGLYHKAKSWGAKVVVIVGTALDPKETKLWEEIERQLTGKVELTKGDTAPGKEKLIKIFSENLPVFILVDELLEYFAKAEGIKIGDSNLATQSLAFLQELTEAISALDKTLLVTTLSSRPLEHWNEGIEKMFQQIKSLCGRVEKVYTPVEDDEIAKVIQRRLFKVINQSEAKKVVDKFIELARKNGLISEDECKDYRERFLASYPFKPEVIDILYKRWGSFPTFQRTRGVLRLLSLVVHDLLKKNLPFIRLGDFNLNNEEIRKELVKHIGSEWDSIIAQDITSRDSGAKKVDISLGSSYLPYSLGTVITTTIFMMSHSGKGEVGAGYREVKLYTLTFDFEASIIDTALNQLRERLFYLSDDKLVFTTQPNLNKIIVSREDLITENEIYEKERELLEKYLKDFQRLKIFIYPKFSKDIPDNPDLKLIVLDREKPDKEFLEKNGDIPRVYRNMLIFLCLDTNQKENFKSFLRKYLALKKIESDKSLKLTETQKKDVKEKIKSFEQMERVELRKLYRKVWLPDKEGFKEIDLGIPNNGGKSSITEEIYNILKLKNEILEKISPKLIQEKYLVEKDYIEITKLYEVFLRTPGEIRLISKEGFIQSIKEGVRLGLFGFGYLVEGKPECKEIKKEVKITFEENEIILKPEFCIEEKEEKFKEEKKMEGTIIKEPIPEIYGPKIIEQSKPTFKQLNLRLQVPYGKASILTRIISYLTNKFTEVEVSISATNGNLEISEYEDKILEALNQAGIIIVEEKKS